MTEQELNDRVERQIRSCEAAKHVPRLVDGLVRYYVGHVDPGSFLQAVLEGSLYEAAGKADLDHQANLWWAASLVYECLPTKAYGDARRVAEWLQQRQVSR